MKKTIFSLIIVLLLHTLTVGIFYLPDDVIYEIKRPASELKWWVNIWGFIVGAILSYCALHYYFNLGGKLFDYIKED